MHINQKIRILISEPWDFISYDGGNRLYGTICGFVKANAGDAYLFKTDKTIKYGEFDIDYLVLQKRNLDDINIIVNICYIDNETTEEFEQFDEIYKELKFIMIGRIESEYT